MSVYLYTMRFRFTQNEYFGLPYDREIFNLLREFEFTRKLISVYPPGWSNFEKHNFSLPGRANFSLPGRVHFSLPRWTSDVWERSFQFTCDGSENFGLPRYQGEFQFTLTKSIISVYPAEKDNFSLPDFTLLKRSCAEIPGDTIIVVNWNHHNNRSKLKLIFLVVIVNWSFLGFG